MTSIADDILFEPIVTNSSTNLLIDQQMIDAVKIALTGVAGLEFFVDPDIDVTTYDMIADTIENNQHVIAYTQTFVAPDSLHVIRPVNSLTIKDVFRHLHAGQTAFWFCGRGNPNGC